MKDKQLKLIKIREINNGYIVEAENSIYFNGERAFYATKEMELLEHIGKIIFSDKYWRFK